MSEALALAVIEHLGPAALAHGKMSVLEAFEKGWQAAILAERERCATLVLDSVKHTRLELLENIRKGEPS